MSATDRRLLGIPTNSFRKDFTLYTGAGVGGGGGLSVAGVQRQSYYNDISKFDVWLRTITYRNQSFQVFSDSGGVNNMPLYFGIAASNDRPTEQIIAAATVANGLKFTTAPPYDVTLNDIGAPFSDLNSTIQGQKFLVDGSFFYDQGGYCYPNITTAKGYTFGNNNKVIQSFVPQSNKIMNLGISGLFLDNAVNSNDHTQYDDLVIEIWDQNKTILYSETIPKLASSLPTGGMPSWYPYTWDRISSKTTKVADDGLTYWTNLVGYKLLPPTPIAVSPGATYYLCVKQANNHASSNYGVGHNLNSDLSGIDTSKGQYINGQLYFAAYASTTLSTLGPTGACIGFVTTRDVGRFCLTVCWDSSAYYWYNPATNTDQIKVTRVDSDRRI